ncbi:MAG: proteinral secretion pathway protein [Desulfobulbaceae bacterium]|jgi:general secretion pathway protein D/MSHA biogenesis protein MshL|nr:MAG: proteinral secretion pathway protein [Desulfobulbaceae bacterium]
MKLSSQLGSQVTSLLALFLVSFTFFACTPTNDSEKATTEAIKPEATSAMPVTRDMTPPSLPVQYQKPAYTIDSPSKDELNSQADDAVLKVGARINSTKKVALREIMKPLASQKRLNISWSSDVNQDALVDVDIKADDDFYKAIDNILRQVDYFYELQGSTIVIKYRETKQFQVAMPFTKQSFSTGTGGNVLGGDVGGEGIAKNVEGTIKLVSEKNEFDIWNNIKANMESILKVEHTKKITSLKNQGAPESTGKNPSTSNKPKDSIKESAPNVMSEEVEVTGGAENYYMIDKPVGLVTVTAPRPVIEKVAAYFTSLQNEIYKQISIEAKIIEVILIDNSSIGINWDSVLKNFQVTGQVAFGNGGSIFTWDPTTGSTSNRIVSNVSINTLNFEAFLNALKTQGNTKVLSNPKISVLNGQPAMITVGQNITYIDKIEVDVDTETNTRTYTAETANILSGVGMALTATILNNNEIILNLVPVTSELQGEIEYRSVGEGEVGLPVVNVREMSTTVRVKNGDMLVIGGLISDVNQNDDNFAPVLGDIPLVKYLFGHSEQVKSKRELIILLKPRII